ncbi:MAG: hypothetical protein GXO32_07230 [Crenarchaeota archaeon]|nr:hypothetical protein [Thermoproteota archaeon]
MTIYVDDIDVPTLEELIDACSDSEELKPCVYRAMASSVSRSQNLYLPKLCREPFWLYLKLGSRRAYIAYNGALDELFAISSCSFLRTRSAVVASEEVYRYLGGAPARIRIVVPGKGLSLLLRCRGALSPIKAIVRAISIASVLACASHRSRVGSSRLSSSHSPHHV